MIKIPSLFVRNWEGNRQIRNEVTPGAEWVVRGEGTAFEKLDGTSCMVQDGKLYARYMRKPNKRGRKEHVEGAKWKSTDLKFHPKYASQWVPAQESPDIITGNWPGWIPVNDQDSQFKFHTEALEEAQILYASFSSPRYDEEVAFPLKSCAKFFVVISKLAIKIRTNECFNIS